MIVALHQHYVCYNLDLIRGIGGSGAKRGVLLAIADCIAAPTS